MQFDASCRATRAAARCTLADVGKLVEREKEQDSISRINGRPAITIDIHKSQDANIVETGAASAAVEALKARLPSDVEVRIGYSTADRSSAASTASSETIIEGGAAHGR